MSEKNLTGQVAIVTGGGRGIGRAIALALAAAGAKVTITATRQPNEIEGVAREIEAAAGKGAGKGACLALPSDVTRGAQCRDVVERTLEAFGRVDVLVNNAGRGHRFVYEANQHLPEDERLKFWNVPSDVWRMTVNVNVNGPFLMAKAVAPHMIEQGRGRIINILATFNTMQKGGNAPYGVTKTALESETQIWARDLAGTGVTVNGLLPGGATATGMVYESNAARPGRVLLDPAIMGPPAVWLASNASEGITGRRIDAKNWDVSLPPDQAAERAFAPPALPPID